MTRTKRKLAVAAAQELIKGNPDGLREIVRAVLQEILEAEMTDALGAAKSERTVARLGYRAGYDSRTLITRVGKLELRVPQDRDGRFSTELFERYQRSEQALVATLAEMYVQGVSTRKVKAITEERCGHAFSASTISAINQRLDKSLAAFARRRLAEPFADLILDARDEKVREAGVVCSQAVLVAVGIDWAGRRQILAVELANRESQSSWKGWPTGRANPPGRASCWACASVVGTGSSSSSPMTMRACGQRSARCCRRRPSRGAMSISSGTPSTICRARPTTTVCKSCGGSTIDASWQRHGLIWPRG
jgi:putative transposase